MDFVRGFLEVKGCSGKSEYFRKGVRQAQHADVNSVWQKGRLTHLIILTSAMIKPALNP